MARLPKTACVILAAANLSDQAAAKTGRAHVKASIIGTGFGSRVVAMVYGKVGVEVEVVSPRDAEAVRRACAAPVDFVSIHSPPFLHRDHVMLALEHGKNVVCDKPFGRSAAEAREMLAAAEAAGVVHMLNFEFRHEPVRVQAKALMDEGAIGTPTHVQWSAPMLGGRQPLKPYSWLFDRDLGGGWIGAFGSHAFDALRWWMGEITEVTGVCRTEMPMRPDAEGVMRRCTAEDGFTAAFTFESGATACLDTCFTSPVARPYSIEIFGTEGVLSMNFGTELKLTRTDKADREFTYGPWEGDMHLPAFKPFAETVREAMRERRQVTPSFRDGVAAAEAMDRLRKNAVWTSPGAA
jgi:predicted dehydrogenase